MLASKSIGALSFADPAWDVSNAEFLGANQNSFYVGGQEITPNDLFFKPDGTKMYVIGQAGDDVNEYNLSTAWNISTASFLQLKSISAQETNPQGLFFKPDGTKMYIIGSTGQDVNEYDLSTAWDISTASFLQLFSVAAQESVPLGIFFKPDGTKMYVCGISSINNVNEYSLSTPWNVTTASFVQFFRVLPQTTNPTGIFFRDNGLQMYIISNASNAIWEYDLV